MPNLPRPVANVNALPALIPYADVRRELRLSRYVADKHIKAGRLRTVVAGRNLFIPADDVMAFRNATRERELADRARSAVASLPWYDACRLHRLPLPAALSRRRRHVLCVLHTYVAICAFMGRTGDDVFAKCSKPLKVPVARVAEIGVKLRLSRDNERCEQCARLGPVPESKKLDYLREGVYLSEVTGDHSRTFCGPHFLNVMWQNAEDEIHGVIGDDIYGVLGGAVPRTMFAAESMMLLLAYCHIGGPAEVCVECARAAGVLPIGRGIASGEVRHVELF